MNKEQLKAELHKIEFPEREVLRAIHKGMNRGGTKKGIKKLTFKKAGALTSLAASAFLASGLLFAPVTTVMASVPFIGTIYDKYSLQIGSELFASSLITELQQKAVSNGIELTITSAYYDGNVIGVTFKAEGDRISLENIGMKGPESGYSAQLFNGDEQNQWASTRTELKKTDDGYVAAMEFYNHNSALPEHMSLPITFTSITGIKGLWKFDVPVERLPSETIAVNGKSVYTKNSDYSLHMKAITKGKATTFLTYQTTMPEDGKNDEIRITAFDDKGNRLSKSQANVLALKENNGIFEKDVRELFTSKINENAKYITVHPEILQYEEQTISTLNETTPFIVKSNRFDYQIQVNSVIHEGNQLIVDYMIENVDNKAFRSDIIQNFADFIMLIKTEQIRKGDNGELAMQHMLEHRIRSNEAKADGKLHFQSIFPIDHPEAFNLEDYSLMVPFGSLSRNNPIEMEPIKVNLE